MASPGLLALLFLACGLLAGAGQKPPKHRRPARPTTEVYRQTLSVTRTRGPNGVRIDVTLRASHHGPAGTATPPPELLAAFLPLTAEAIDTRDPSTLEYVFDRIVWAGLQSRLQRIQAARLAAEESDEALQDFALRCGDLLQYVAGVCQAGAQGYAPPSEEAASTPAQD